MLPLYFARRYLFSKKSHSVINIIAGVSLFAIAMPVAAMIILLSVFNGFENLIKEMATAFDAEITITAHEGSSFNRAEFSKFELDKEPYVEGMSWSIEQNALVEYKGRQTTITIRGVDDSYEEVFPIAEAVVSGEYRVKLGDYERCVVGQTLCYTLGIYTFIEPLKLYAINRESFSTLLPLNGFRRQEVQIAGTFSLDAESEQNYILTSLRLAERIFDLEGRATALLVKLNKGVELDEAKRKIEQILGREFDVKTRYELRPTIYNIMTYEKWGIFFISLLVLLIAAFSIVGSLTMLILEKLPECETLKAMGASTQLIRRIFISEGLLIGAMAALVGITLGVSITLIQQHFGIIEMPVESFVTRSYPIEFRIEDLAVIILAYSAVIYIITHLTVKSLIKRF
jgi:lipoprotein-releasing system permease protein